MEAILPKKGDMAMNKIWTLVVVIVLLVGGVAAFGVLYWQKSGNLKEAESQIVTMGLNISTLQTNLTNAQAEVSRLQTELTAAQADVTRLEGELAAANTQVSTLQTSLVAAQAEASRLGGELTTTRAQVSTLQTDLTAAQSNVTRLEGELAAANTQVSTLQSQLTLAQTELATSEAQISELTDELELVKDPRHFKSLTELRNWLEEDDTDEEYEDASPYEIVYILQVRALRDGYLLPAHFEDLDLDGTVDYAGNLAYIGEEIYYVWPYDDSNYLWAYVSSIPSHPLPLD
jgi:predicted  nucleic acid-binding Zn-ribbon protein